MPHYLVLGATGACGIAFAHAALAAGHTLTLYVRTPSKVDPALQSHGKVTVVTGQMADKATLHKALTEGAVDGVVSFVGPATMAGAGTPITDGYRDGVFPAMKEAGVKRVLVLCTSSHPDPSDHSTLMYRTMIAILRLVANPAYTEIRAVGTLTVSQPLEEVEWTLFRVPYLTNGAAGPVHAGFVGDAGDRMPLSRAGLAEWCLSELKEGQWIGKAPKLSNA